MVFVVVVVVATTCIFVTSIGVVVAGVRTGAHNGDVGAAHRQGMNTSSHSQQNASEGQRRQRRTRFAGDTQPLCKVEAHILEFSKGH